MNNHSVFFYYCSKVLGNVKRIMWEYFDSGVGTGLFRIDLISSPPPQPRPIPTKKAPRGCVGLLYDCSS